MSFALEACAGLPICESSSISLDSDLSCAPAPEARHREARLEAGRQYLARLYAACPGAAAAIVCPACQRPTSIRGDKCFQCREAEADEDDGTPPLVSAAAAPEDALADSEVVPSFFIEVVCMSGHLFDMEVDPADGQKPAAVGADAAASVDASATAGSTATSDQTPVNQIDSS